MSTIIITSILIIFGYAEAYGQTMANTTATGGISADGGDDGGTNGTRSDIIDCLVSTCINPDF